MIGLHQLLALPFSLPFLLALLVSLLSPYIVKPLLQRAGVIDVPNERSSHESVAIRGMGISIAAAIVIGFLAAAGFTVMGDGQLILVVCSLVALAAATLGWLEDIRGVSVKVRAAVQLGIGLLGTAGLILVTGQNWMWLVAGAVAVAAYINVVNFMDGLDGISGLHAVVVGLAFAVAGMLTPSNWLTIAGLVIAAAGAGFLPWNMGKGLVFMGDVGSYVLGGTIAIVSVGAFLDGVKVEYIFSPTLIYLADTAYTLVKRAREGKAWYVSHREHVYQRITDLGVSRLGSALIVTAFSVGTSVLGILAAAGQIGVSIGATILCIVLIIAYLSLPGFLAKRRADQSEQPA
ncbi:MraY family glycosyltransferase [Haematomicrobium sanguinis]|uniref:MraY family glycosyltransferase n=1 Tax=Haematomicrobium sanguinis TaxID=479106 RepID=UPI000556501B|nr:glycosyltransferase family 4 protein [Haematomicrobium sanguinis]